MSSSSQVSERHDIEIINVNGNEELVNLSYEPTIIKGRGGERLWYAEATRDCATICKLQLKVGVFWRFTNE
jgi:hypothetical protein